MNMEKLSVPLAIVLAGGLIAGAFYFSNVKNAKELVKANAMPQQVTGGENMRPITSEDHILGNPNAKLMIVEYSDTECPFCKQFHGTLKQVMSEYGDDGQVAWVYRHFPIDQLHAKARREAEASECANELGGSSKFWEYLDTIYVRTNSNDSLPESELPKIAKDVGLDVAKFNECLSSGRYSAKVQADYDDAVASGGRGTPHSIIVSRDGTKTVVQGAQPYANLKRVIDALLTE